MLSYDRKSNQVSSKQLQIIFITLLVIVSMVWVVNQESTRSASIPNDNLHILIAEAKEIRQELSLKQPAPKLIDTWRKVSAATKIFDLDVELLSSNAAEQAKMYTGPLPSWHLKVMGETPNVLTFLKSINDANLYVYSYHYMLEDSQMNVMMSVVGNI